MVIVSQTSTETFFKHDINITSEYQDGVLMDFPTHIDAIFTRPELS